MSRQQASYRKGIIREDKKQKLEEIGLRLCWKADRDVSSYDDAWNDMYECLKQYRLKNGHCFCSQSYYVNGRHEKKNLGKWVAEQRAMRRNGNLKAHREELLNALDFVWDVDHGDAQSSQLQQIWDEAFTELIAFKKEHGHCRVPDPKWERDSLGDGLKSNAPVLNKAESTSGVWKRA